MKVTLSRPTWEILEKRMRQGEYDSADDLIRIALEALEDLAVEELDAGTQAAIERAEEQADRGEGVPVNEVLQQLRAKHFGP